MNLKGALELARRGELYPSVILHGGSAEERPAAALELARTLLCVEEPVEARPCGSCRNCRRIVWPGGGGDQLFHPDFRILERDLKTSTSVAATRELLRLAQVSPFEARGQVFVVANAETLTGEAANSLLKALEEPPDSAPRHYLLLAPSRLDLLPTLRSRSLALYLGPAAEIEGAKVDELADELAEVLAAWSSTKAVVYLLAAADVLGKAGGWDDPRSGRPWATAAAALVELARRGEHPPELRRRLLALAHALLAAPAMRMRAVTPARILEGLLTRHLAGA